MAGCLFITKPLSKPMMTQSFSTLSGHSELTKISFSAGVGDPVRDSGGNSEEEEDLPLDGGESCCLQSKDSSYRTEISCRFVFLGQIWQTNLIFSKWKCLAWNSYEFVYWNQIESNLLYGKQSHVNGFMITRHNFIPNALELRLFCIKQSMCDDTALASDHLQA